MGKIPSNQDRAWSRFSLEQEVRPEISRGLWPPGFCYVLGESHDSHWKGKFPTLVVADSSLEAPNLPWVGIEMLDK